jgi:mono/diheme cytochrome c family protein
MRILLAAVAILPFVLLGPSMAAFNRGLLPVMAAATSADLAALFGSKCASCHGRSGLPN